MISDKIYTEEDVLLFLSNFYSNIRRLWIDARKKIIKMMSGALNVRATIVKNEVIDEPSYSKVITAKAIVDIILTNFNNQVKQATNTVIGQTVARIDSKNFRDLIKSELDRNQIYIDRQIKNTQDLIKEVITQRYKTKKDVVERVSKILRLDRDSLIESFNSEIAKYLKQLNSGEINISSFRNIFETRLKNHFFAMYKAGKGTDKLEKEDIDFVNREFKTQLSFIDNFIKDIIVKLQTGRQLGDREIWRAGLYGNRGGGLYEAGYLASLGKDVKINWVLGVAEHCPDCVANANASPFTRYTLPSFPGDGTTRCRTNCQCHLEIAEETVKDVLNNMPSGQSLYIPTPHGEFYSDGKIKFTEDIVHYSIGFNVETPIVYRGGNFAEEVNVYFNGKTNKIEYLEEVLRRIPKKFFKELQNIYVADAELENGQFARIIRNNLYIGKGALQEKEGVGLVLAQAQKGYVKKFFNVNFDTDDFYGVYNIRKDQVFADYVKSRIADLESSKVKRFLYLDVDSKEEMLYNLSEYLLTGQITDADGVMMENLTNWARANWAFSGEIDKDFVFGKNPTSKYLKKLLRNAVPSKFVLKVKRAETAKEAREQIYKLMEDYYHITEVERKRIADLQTKIVAGQATEIEKRNFKEIISAITQEREKFNEVVYKILVANPEKDYSFAVKPKIGEGAEVTPKDVIERVNRTLKLVDENQFYMNYINVYVEKDLRRAFFDKMALNVSGEVGWEHEIDHELGHWIENNFTSDNKKKVRDFFEKRTKNEKAVSLRDVLGAGYSQDEVAKIDKFIHPYIGKIYTSGDTELVSMALEMFAGGEITELVITDPDYFDFFFNLFRGLLK